MRNTLRTFLILLIIGLAFLRFGYLPYKQKLSEKKELYSELTQAYLQKRANFQRIKMSGTLKKDFKKSPENKEIEKVYRLVYPKSEDPFLLQIKISKDLKGLAEKKGVKVQGLDFLSFPAGMKRLTEIPLVLKGRGKTKDVLEFLEEVEKYFYQKEKFYKVSELVLRESRGELELNLKISVFKSEV